MKDSREYFDTSEQLSHSSVISGELVEPDLTPEQLYELVESQKDAQDYRGLLKTFESVVGKRYLMTGFKVAERTGKELATYIEPKMVAPMTYEIESASVPGFDDCISITYPGSKGAKAYIIPRTYAIIVTEKEKQRVEMVYRRDSNPSR